MSTFERLVSLNSDIWERYKNHNFILGIQNGNLDIGKFRYYLIQDLLYLKQYAKILQSGVKKATSKKVKDTFQKYYKEITMGEMNTRKYYLDKFNITDLDIDRTKPAVATIEYSNFLNEIACTESQESILCAIAYCAYSYEVIANNIERKNPNIIYNEFFGDWVREYVSKEYHLNNINIINLFNDLTKDCDENEMNKYIEIYKNSERFEKNFWDMAWNSK